MPKPTATPPVSPDSLPSIATTTEQHPVRLTAEEHRLRGVELAAASIEVNRNAAEMKETVKLLKAAHKDLEEERDRLAEVVQNRAEPRPVAVEVRADFTAGTAYHVRLDTGEVVKARELTESEIDDEQRLFRRAPNRAQDDRP